MYHVRVQRLLSLEHYFASENLAVKSFGRIMTENVTFQVVAFVKSIKKNRQ